jgi:hypothetical protein
MLGTRKVILATNIAESSITVPDVAHVIDFGLIKELYYDSRTSLVRFPPARSAIGQCGLTRCWACECRRVFSCSGPARPAPSSAWDEPAGATSQTFSRFAHSSRA